MESRSSYISSLAVGHRMPPSAFSEILFAKDGGWRLCHRSFLGTRKSKLVALMRVVAMYRPASLITCSLMRSPPITAESSLRSNGTPRRAQRANSRRAPRLGVDFLWQTPKNSCLLVAVCRS